MMLCISDNGKTFKQFLLKRGHSTKRCLKKVLGSSRLTYKEMLTILVEVEGVLNSRPLNYVYSEDIDETLILSHLLLGRRLLSKPEVSEDINVANDAEEHTR